MSLLRWPGLVDVHVHVREPGATHKEDWETATAAALAGGFTAILAMPNTKPPIVNAASLRLALDAARRKARVDYAQYVGGTATNAAELPTLAPEAAGLKLYLSHTYGLLWLQDMALWPALFRAWPKHRPLVVHAERHTLAAALFFARLCDRPIHIAHVAYREEILTIRAAKERGWPVTCEVTPHHLFLTAADVADRGGWGEVRPRLGTSRDRDALWENLAVCDIFATDHAPHTREEKAWPNPPPGFPGLETALPLLLTAAHQGRLTYDDIVARLHTNPRRIFGLPAQPDTWVEIDPQAEWTFPDRGWFTRADWSPFAGWRVRGRVQRVVLRGQTAFEQGQVLAPPGSGRSLRTPQER